MPHFADAKGWYPGLELRGEDLFFRDIDASVVVPSKDNRRYTTRIVDADGNPLTDLYGTDLGDGIILGSGNPADGNPLDTPVEDLSLGVQFEVRRVAGNNRWVVVAVNAAKADNTPSALGHLPSGHGRPARPGAALAVPAPVPRRMPPPDQPRSCDEGLADLTDPCMNEAARWARDGSAQVEGSGAGTTGCDHQDGCPSAI